MKIPILLNFDESKAVGWLEIDDKYKNFFPEMSLSPSTRDGEVISLSLVPTDNYVEAIKKLLSLFGNFDGNEKTKKD